MNRLVPLGLLAFALAVAAAVAPGLVPVPLDRALVPVAGAGVLALAYRAVAARRRSGVRRTGTADPEVAAGAPVPGADLYAAIRAFSGGRGYYSREGLRDAAAAVLTRYGGFSAEEVRAQLADGSWTDDPLAAAHLREEAGDASVVRRVSRRVRRESSYLAGRRRAAEAIARHAGVAVEPSGRRPVIPRGIPFDDRVEEVPVTDGPGRLDTGNWRGVSAVALAAVGVGALADLPQVVLSGVVGVGAAAYARVATPPTVDLHVAREVGKTRPDGGAAVDVTLTVRNEGSRILPDLRVVDGVPEALSVVSGSPRLGTALRPGERATVSYAVEARRGVHSFEPVTLLARDLAGVAEVRRTVAVGTTLTCVPTPRGIEAPVPLRTAATRYAGRVRTSTGGEGVEFFASRAYRPGDPTNRIDWNRRARTGELVTIDYREERAATVVVVVDARDPCFVAHEPHAPHAVDRAAEGAGRVVETLLEAGDRVGVAAFGTDCWLPPGSGRDQGARARELLATHPALASDGPRDDATMGWRRRLERRLPAGAQLVVLSPLCDGEAARLVRRLDVAGHPTTVVSPDPTSGDGTGPLLARTARRVRITDLRRARVPVVDWAPTEPLEVPFARHAAGGST